ncbi:MAG: hypothetical protein DMG15_13095 [Acidobacteria bacterium]|nr:MAG: hypothetical protein DMG15_13095 [Acidobacteriota bacterium]
MPPQPEGRMAVAGSMPRRASSPMKEHRLLGAPSLLPASAMRAPLHFQRERELELLIGREVRVLLENAGVVLASYRDLGDCRNNG